MTTQSSTSKLYVRPPALVGSVPFENDLLGRKPLGDRLKGYIAGMSDGGVIGITADWGDGKSWFGRNLCAALKADGHKTFYFDAFESDFSEDAFVAISGQLLAGISTDASTKASLFEASKRLGVTLLPAFVKVGIGAGLRAVAGVSPEALRDLTTQFADSSASAAEKLVESRLKEHEAVSKVVQTFRKCLSDICAAEAKPVVFFIDELDRCRPTFAVHVIERIKHFFDVPNLVFILLLNREQLQAAIRGLYGERIDAPSYLAKLVHFFLTLPSAKEMTSKASFKDFCFKIAERHGYRSDRNVEVFVDVLADIAPHMLLSLRDCERIFILYGLAARMRGNPALNAVAAVIKLKKPELFTQLMRGEPAGIERFSELVRDISKKEGDHWLWERLVAFGRNWARGFQDMSQGDQELIYGFLESTGSSRAGAHSILRNTFARFDLPMPE